MPSKQDLLDRIKETSDEIQKGDYFPKVGAGSPGSIHGLPYNAMRLAVHSAQHSEAVVAVLLDAVERYAEAAAKDREAQDKNRQAEALAREEREKRDDKYLAGQRLQGWIMLVFTIVIAISTASYTVAAWKQVQQSERVAVPIVAKPAIVATPTDPQSPQSPTRDQ